MVREQLRRDLAAARKAGDSAWTSVIRSLLAAIDNAEAVDTALHDDRTEVSRRHLSDEDITGIIRREVEELRHAAREYAAAGDVDEAARLGSMATMAERYASDGRA